MKRKTKIVLLGLFLFLGVLVLAGAGLIYVAVRPPLPGQAVLLLEIGGEIPETQASDLFSLLLGEEKRSLLEYDLLLEHAAEDDRIAGVLVRISPLAMGWARIGELRQSLSRIRDAGKPLIAHFEMATDREVYLSSVADRVFCAPEAFLLVGLAVQPSYFKGTLDKLHIEADFEQVGRYKSAAESLTRSSMSEEFEESINALLDAIHVEYRDAIAESRGLETSAVQEFLDRGLSSGEGAVEAGLVDQLAYDDQVKDYLQDVLALAEEPEMLSEHKYWRRIAGDVRGGYQNRIAVIYAEGMIYTGHESPGFFGEKGIWSRTHSGYLREAREDDDIKAVVLRVDSPGGSGTASDLIWREVVLTREAGKPVVVSMGDLAASGGYYISMAADRILAQSTTVTGSIGVLAGKLNMGGFYQWIGTNIETVKRSEHADMFSSARAFSPQEKEILRSDLERFYRGFVTKAAEGRGTEYETLERVAQGRVWSGKDALAGGLVDELGGLRQAIDSAKALAGISSDEEVTLVLYPRTKGFFEMIRGREAAATRSALPRPLVEIAEQYHSLERLSQERILALLPNWFEWD